MKQNQRWAAIETRKIVSAFLVSLLMFGQIFAQTVAPAKTALTAAERELAAKINVQTIKDYTAALSSKEMEGRGTMQPGGDRAANWIADRFKALGMKPLGDAGSFLQRVEFKETVQTPETVFAIGDEKLALGSDYGIYPLNDSDKDVSGELIFAAYGIQAKSNAPVDLSGVDVKGKVVVLVSGRPAGVAKKDWAADKAAMFRNILIQRGVAAIVYIGNGGAEDSPEEAISYFSRRQIKMPDETGAPPFIPPFIFVGSKASEKLFAKSGMALKEALKQAEENTFKPMALNQKAKLVLKYKTTKGFASNVVGVIEGSDPKLKEEAVLFSAHYDAYGIENGKIYYGAADNALGTAEMLAVAEAFAKSPAKPKRSLIFLAVTGEEYGLYGSKYWAKSPTWDIKKVAANLNLDGVGTEVYGPVKTMVGYGAEHSTLGAMLQDVSGAMGITVAPDPVPDEKVFYRSDHYSFVERGVPALMLMGAPEDLPLAMKRMREWEKTNYHQPGDTIQPDWSWEGAKGVADVMGIMGLRIANSDAMPSWLATSRFAKLERGNTKELPEEQ